MNGVHLLRELRQRSPTTVLTIMTADPSVKSAIEASHVYVFDYLVKPFTLEQLEELVGRSLEHRRQRDLMSLRTSRAFDDPNSTRTEELPPRTS